MNILSAIKSINKNETKTIEEKVLKATEEIGELAEAVLSSSNKSGSAYKNKSIEDIVEEAIDLAIISQSIALDVSSVEGIEDIYKKKLQKWEDNQHG